MLKLRLLLGLSVLSLVVGVTACGDDPASGPGNGEPDADMGADVPDVQDDTPQVNPNRLVLVTEPEPSVSFSERVPIQVRYVTPDNTPIPDAFIAFETQQDTADTRLSARNALSNGEGVAETFIEAGVQQVDFDVRIAVDDDTVTPLTVRVRIQPKDASDFIVRVNYDGPVRLNRVEVLLYDTDRACNSLTESPEDNPSADVAWTSLVILPDAEGDIPDRGLNVPRDLQLHYAVARGEPSDNQGGGYDYFSTFGCQDEIPLPEVASATVIEIDMHDLWPEMEGTYRIDSEINLLNLIPDQVEDFIGPIGEIFRSPGLGILRLVAVSLAGDQYYTESPWNALFECSVDLDENGDCDGDVNLTTLGAVAAAAAEAVFDIGIALLPDAVGNTIQDVLSAGASVFENAENFSMGGNLVITQDPDAAGLLGNTNSIVFNEITWFWRDLDTDQPTERTIDLRNQSFMRGENIVASVVFHPAEDEDAVYSIQLDPFDLSLNYGELLIWVLEGIVFPEFIGPNVTSFEDLFGEILDCDDLAQQLEDDGAGIAADAARSACQALQTTAIAALEDWLTSLTLDLSTYYHMGTPVDDPCRMTLAPNRFKVQALGDSNIADRCEWAGEIRYTSDGASEEVDGEFWGELL